MTWEWSWGWPYSNYPRTQHMFKQTKRALPRFYESLGLITSIGHWHRGEALLLWVKQLRLKIIQRLKWKDWIAVMLDVLKFWSGPNQCISDLVPLMLGEQHLIEVVGTAQQLTTNLHDWSCASACNKVRTDFLITIDHLSTHHVSLRGISFNGQWPGDILGCEEKQHNHHLKKPSLALPT